MEILLGDWDSLGSRAKVVRFDVFVSEQGVSPSIEYDGQDGQSVHALAIDADGSAAATGRLLANAHIGRMAVLPKYRGQGVGSSVLRALVNEARRLGYGEVVLSAQVHAQEFYQTHGFVADGGIYKDAGIDHILMRLRLT